MSYETELKQSQVIYSLMSGHNSYLYDGNTRNVFSKPEKILRHVKPNSLKDGNKQIKEFYAKALPVELNNCFNLEYWINLIRKPVELQYYIWPVDLVDFSQKSGERAYALVFPFRTLPQFEHIAPFLYNLDLVSDDHLGLKNTEVKVLINNLLAAWCAFDNSDYSYHEFSYENMYYTKSNHAAMFDFSFSTHKALELSDSAVVPDNRITSDYADTNYYRSGNQKMDLASDYVSIATILFKLLIGRLPYNGMILEGDENLEGDSHETWMRLYHQNPIFIFDADDDSNRISPTSNPETYEERWNSLNESVRNMFHNTFQTVNVLRETDELTFYTPLEWKKALDNTLNIPLKNKMKNIKRKLVTAPESTLQAKKQDDVSTQVQIVEQNAVVNRNSEDISEIIDSKVSPSRIDDERTELMHKIASILSESISVQIQKVVNVLYKSVSSQMQRVVNVLSGITSAPCEK